MFSYSIYKMFTTGCTGLLPELRPLVDDDLGWVSPRCPGLVEARQERLGQRDELAGLAAAPALLREGAVPVHRVWRARYHHVRALKVSHVGGLYRVTRQVVLKVLLTSKSRLHFSIDSVY